MEREQIVSTLRFFGIKKYDGKNQEGRFAAYDRDSLCTDQIGNTSSKSWTKSSYVIISENANYTLDECKEKWRNLNKKLSYLYARFLIIEDSGVWLVFDNNNYEITIEDLFPDFYKVLAADESVRNVAYKIFRYLCNFKPAFFENEICNKLTKSTSSSYTGSLYALPSFPSLIFQE